MLYTGGSAVGVFTPVSSHTPEEGVVLSPYNGCVVARQQEFSSYMIISWDHGRVMCGT
jgi:hypothetical protein